MGCRCKQTGLGLLALACPGAGKGQLLKSLAPSLHHTQQVRGGEEQNGWLGLLQPCSAWPVLSCRQKARGCVAHRHFAPLWELQEALKGPGATLSVPARGMPACGPLRASQSHRALPEACPLIFCFGDSGETQELLYITSSQVGSVVSQNTA